jgi:hypothetical protein
VDQHLATALKQALIQGVYAVNLEVPFFAGGIVEAACDCLVYYDPMFLLPLFLLRSADVHVFERQERVDRPEFARL